MNTSLTNEYLSGQTSGVYYDQKKGLVYTPNVKASMLGLNNFELAPYSDSTIKKTNSNSSYKIKKINKYPTEKRSRVINPVSEERRCIATCLSGEQCSKSRLNGSEYCRMHQNKLNPKKVSPKNNEVSAEKLGKNNCIGKNCAIMGGKRTKRQVKTNKKRTNKRY